MFMLIFSFDFELTSYLSYTAGITFNSVYGYLKSLADNVLFSELGGKVLPGTLISLFAVLILHVPTKLFSYSTTIKVSKRKKRIWRKCSQVNALKPLILYLCHSINKQNIWQEESAITFSNIEKQNSG